MNLYSSILVLGQVHITQAHDPRQISFKLRGCTNRVARDKGRRTLEHNTMAIKPPYQHRAVSGAKHE